MITTATAMISAVAITTATTPPTIMAMELLVLGLDGGVVSVMEPGPTCSAEKSEKDTECLSQN